MGFKYNFNSQYCTFILFSSQNKLFAPGLKDGVDNIKLPENCFFKYVNPLIIARNGSFANYMTLDKEFPMYIARETPLFLVEETLKAVKYSFIHTTEGSDRQIYLENNYKIFSYYLKENKNFFAYTTAKNTLYTPFQLNLFSEARIRAEELEKFNLKIIQGYGEGEKHDLIISLSSKLHSF